METTGKRVLLVEDDRFLRRACEASLRQRGLAVTTAADGEEGLRLARSEQPDLILLDMLMPIMNGWQCATELRARFGQDVPIVVVTAAEHAHARAAQIGGVADVLQKPFDMDDLLDIVGRYASKKASVEH